MNKSIMKKLFLSVSVFMVIVLSCYFQPMMITESIGYSQSVLLLYEVKKGWHLFNPLLNRCQPFCLKFVLYNDLT